MATFDAVRAVRFALTVERFDLAVQFYRDRLGLAVVEEGQRPEGHARTQMLEGAAALYRLVEQTELGAETPEERHRGQSLAEVTGILVDVLTKETKQVE